MAVVTFGNPKPARHVIGDLVVKLFVVSGASGSTIPTGMRNILYVNQQAFTQAGTASLITGITVAGSIITLTSSAPMVSEVVEVISKGG